MPKMKVENISLSFGECLLFKIDALQMEESKKVGIVGLNGFGKNILLAL